MNCSRFETLLTDYLEDVLDSRLKKALKQHLEECDRCTLLLEQVSRVRDELSSFPTLSVSEELVEEIIQRTSGRRRRALFRDLLLLTLRPFATQRFAFATALMFVFLSLVVNLLGPGFSAASYSDLRPSTLVEEAERVAHRTYRNWMLFNSYKERVLEEARLLREDLYGRLDYHLVTLLFRSYQEGRQQAPETPSEEEGM